MDNILDRINKYNMYKNGIKATHLVLSSNIYEALVVEIANSDFNTCRTAESLKKYCHEMKFYHGLQIIVISVSYTHLTLPTTPYV